MTDLKEELDEKIRTGDELSTLDLYFNKISDRDRERKKTTKKGNKSRKKGPMMREVRNEESENEQDTETPAEKETPAKDKKPRARSEKSDSGEDHGTETSAQKGTPAKGRKPWLRENPDPKANKKQQRLNQKDESTATTATKEKKLKLTASPIDAADFINPKAVFKSLQQALPEKVRRYQELAGPGLFDDGDEDKLVSASDVLDQTRKPKRQRPTAAEMRSKLGDDRVKRDVPEKKRESDAELLQIGLDSMDQENKRRWRVAPYCWNAKGFLYDKYYYLVDKRDEVTREYIWNDKLLWKFA